MSSKDYPKVDFIGIGFPRSGTTWLARCLSEHPEICFSTEKEIHFFDLDYNFEKGASFYKKFFTCKEGAKVAGEFTPEYIRVPEKAARRIKETYPDVKLIIVMRDPVLRSFSHYRYRKYKAGRYKSFKELIENAETDPIIKESRYIRELAPFLSLFNMENILFLIHEESLKDPVNYLKQVYTFLGVDPTFRAPSLERKVNISDNQGTRFSRPEHWINKLRWVLRGSVVGRMILSVARAIGITKLITKLRGMNRVPVKNPERVTREDYETLWRYFEPSVQKLEERIGRDLSQYWGKYRTEEESAQRAS